jgi:hypothetical protein
MISRKILDIKSDVYRNYNLFRYEHDFVDQPDPVIILLIE